MGTTAVIAFIGTVFIAVFVLMLGLTTSASGDSRMRRTLRRRLERIGADAQQDFASILRDKYLKSLTPFERRLEELPLMERIAEMSEQAGRPAPAYRLIVTSLLAAIVGALLGALLLHSGLVALGAAIIGLVLPYGRLSLLRRQRLQKIEEQIPDAIDIIKRALRAGHPFNAAIKLVADDMDQPVAGDL